MYWLIQELTFTALVSLWFILAVLFLMGVQS